MTIIQGSCTSYEVNGYNYRYFEIGNEQRPDGYRVQFPFYVEADRNAFIKLSEVQDPDLENDNYYELKLAG